MDTLNDEKKRGELQAQFARIVGYGSTVRTGAVLEPVPKVLSVAFVDRAVRWESDFIQVGDLSVMRALPILEPDSTVTNWCMRVRWSVPWWDDSYTKDHHRFEVDRYLVEPGGLGDTFVGIDSRADVAYMVHGFQNPDEEEKDIVRNYRAWIRYRKKNADRFVELDARVLEFEELVMRENDRA